MPTGLERRYGRGDLHFITCSCYRKLPLLRSGDSRDVFVKILAEIRDRVGFALVGYVVMPEHIHLLISEPPEGTPSMVLQLLKQDVSRCLDRETGHGGQSLPKFWEPRFYDFNVWSLKKKIEKLNYMHMNPVKRGLVSNPKDWVWSSFSFYANRERGLIQIDRW
jgi:putative transposase